MTSRSAVWFNKDIDRVELLRAETIDRAGVAHPVGPEAIRDVQEPRSAGAPFFEDGVLRSVIFPGVDAGARTRLVFRKSRTKPRDPGYFGYFAAPSRMPVEAQRLIFDLPADMPLYADARGYVARAPVTENGRTRYAFDYRHGPYPRIEEGSVGYTTYGDRLMVSTLRDFAAFAGRYRAAAADASAADPAVARLAQAIVANANAAGPRAKARAIYDWVRTHVRYVALFLGETAAAPHKVTDILRNRYGDCKDHVALFGALLAAAGIRSEPALLNLGAVYTLPDVPGYGGGAISHAITWLPDLGLFADTTVGGVEFGYLPPVVMDRPVLLVDDGVLSRTPAAQPRTRDARLRIDVAPDGDARYQYHVEDGGWPAEFERGAFRQAARERVRQLAADRLRQSGLRGTARLGTSERDDGRAVLDFDDGCARTLRLARRHDRAAGAVEPRGRHRDAGAGLARGARAHAAVAVHRRRLRRDRADRAAREPARDRSARRRGRARSLLRLRIALRVRRAGACRADHAALARASRTKCARRRISRRRAHRSNTSSATRSPRSSCGRSRATERFAVLRNPHRPNRAHRRQRPR